VCGGFWGGLGWYRGWVGVGGKPFPVVKGGGALGLGETRNLVFVVGGGVGSVMSCGCE